jgi:hypothetical protein
LYTFRQGLPGGFTVGLVGLYGSFSFNAVETDEITNFTSTTNGETTYYDVSLGEFVVGYTLDLLSARQWGVGLPLGIGGNKLEKQLVLEAGLQLRVSWVELRGTYRTIGFRDSSFTISAGLCLWPTD